LAKALPAQTVVRSLAIRAMVVERVVARTAFAHLGGTQKALEHEFLVVGVLAVRTEHSSGVTVLAPELVRYTGRVVADFAHVAFFVHGVVETITNCHAFWLFYPPLPFKETTSSSLNTTFSFSLFPLIDFLVGRIYSKREKDREIVKGKERKTNTFSRPKFYH
jgi:hypothetical protein